MAFKLISMPEQQTQANPTQQAAPKRYKLIAPPPDKGEPLSPKSNRELSGIDQVLDVVRSAGSGLRSGVETLAGTAGDVQEMSGNAAAWLAGKAGLSEDAQSIARKAGKLIAIPGMTPNLPTTEKIGQVTERTIGERYQPKSTAGDYARAVGEFAPNAVAGPGGVIRKTAMTVIPAVASETLGKMAEGSKFEPVARAGGAIAGALATGGRGNPSKVLAKNAPSQEQVAKQAGEKYRSLRKAGIEYDPKQYDRIVNFAAKKLQAEGIMAADAPRTHAVVQRMAELTQGGKPDFNQLESIRKGAGAITREGPAVSDTDKTAAGIILRAIDTFTGNARVTTATGQNIGPAASKMAKEARELAQRNIFARDFEEMARKAQNYPSGVESGLREQLKSYLNGKKGKLLQRTNPELYKSMQSARAGSLTRKGIQSLGRFGVDLSPTGALAVLLPTLAGGAAYAGSGGDLAKTATAVAAASGARFVGKKMQVRDFNRAKSVALAGREAQKSVGTAVKARNTATAASAGLSANQSGAGGRDWPDGAMFQIGGRFFDKRGKLIPAT